eukprot:8506307-Pyramimonas_sp.AAC.1
MPPTAWNETSSITFFKFTIGAAAAASRRKAASSTLANVVAHEHPAIAVPFASRGLLVHPWRTARRGAR